MQKQQMITTTKKTKLNMVGNVVKAGIFFQQQQKS